MADWIRVSGPQTLVAAQDGVVGQPLDDEAASRCSPPHRSTLVALVPLLVACPRLRGLLRDFDVAAQRALFGEGEPATAG